MRWVRALYSLTGSQQELDPRRTKLVVAVSVAEHKWNALNLPLGKANLRDDMALSTLSAAVNTADGKVYRYQECQQTRNID